MKWVAKACVYVARYQDLQIQSEVKGKKGEGKERKPDRSLIR